MRNLQVLLLVVVFVFVQFINISAGQNEKVTVHLPVAPSKIIPMTFGVDVMPFDESMGEPYMDSSYHRFRYVVDKNLNIHGPLDIYSKEYEDLTGFKNEKLYPIGYDKNQILDEKMKTENIGFLDNSWEWNTRYIENIYEVNGVYYLELFDFIDMQIAWSSPTVDDEGFMYNDLLFGKFLVFIREIDGSSDKFREKYEYKYIDLKSGKEVLRRKSQRYSKDTLFMTAEKIANLKEGVFIDLPEEIKKIINDEDIRFSVLNRQDLYLVYLTFVGEDEFDYQTTTVMFLLGKDGQIIKRSQFENNGWQNVTYDFNEMYHCVRSAQFIEDEGTFRNQCYKVISFESQEEVLSIPYCDRNHVETLFLAGDFLFSRDYGKFDIYDLKTGELIKRVLANARSGGKNIDGKIYAYDYSHESNWCSDSFVCAFALKDDLTFDYSDSVTSSEINDADSNDRVRCRVDVEENEDAYTVSVESYGGMRGEVSFDVNEEDYFFAGSYYHKGFFCYSYHENGIMRKIDLRTGEILEFGYEKIDLEKYRISPWIDDIDEDETDIVCNDFFGKVFDLEERASGKQRFLVLSINLTTGESNKLVLSSKPKEFIFTPSTIVYYDELMERIEIVKNGGINKHFKGKIITAIGDDLYIDSLENPEYLSGIRYVDRISCIDFSVAKNIFHNEKFPEIDSDIFQVNIDSMPMYWYSSMVDSVQWIRDPQIIYQDRTLHFDAGGDFYNYLYESKPCPTFSIKMIDQGTETITFEIVNTRGDRFGENLSGVFYLMGWGHERCAYKDELKEAAPIYSRFSESIELTDLKFGEKKLLTFRLPERGSVLLSSDFEYFRGLKDSREDLEFVRLEFLGNGVIDVLESELMPSNYYNRSRFGYMSSYEDFVKTQTIWPIRNH